MTKNKDSIETAAALARGRGFLYGFFSDQILAPPISDNRPLDILQSIWSQVDELLGPEPTGVGRGYLGSSEFSADALALEYSDLFRVPGGRYLAPVESVYEKLGADGAGSLGTLRGKSWTDVTRCYNQAGYEIPPGKNFQADHLGCELEFLKALCEMEADAWEGNDTEAAGAVRADQREFLAQHLLSWLPNLKRRLGTMAKLPYYGGLFQTLEAFLAMEQSNLAGDRG